MRLFSQGSEPTTAQRLHWLKVVKYINSNKLSVLVLRDLSATSDTVDHLSGLILKVGLDQISLPGRFLFVFSVMSELACGILQGSILGPVL